MIVVAAQAGCSANSPRLPSPRGGPAATADLRRWALGYAILAPNSHNRQPWLADLREPDAIVLHLDRERMLPETDPWFRQIVVSQGTFIEALVIALQPARRSSPRSQLFPDGEFRRAQRRRPAGGSDHLVPGSRAPRTIRCSPAAARHTAKVDYDTSAPGRASRRSSALAGARPTRTCASAARSMQRGSKRCARCAGKRPGSSCRRRAR